MTRPVYLTDDALNSFIESALAEDIGEGDHSSLAAVPASQTCRARLLVKADGIIAGVSLAEKIFQFFDKRISVTFHKQDGEVVKIGDVAFIVEGPARSILSTERLVVNCMQRMSGIASYTKKLCKIIEGTSARLMDTRKTTPNFRILEKWAVVIGGGLNHRYALYDMIMLKDNHIDMAGGIAAAINNTKTYLAASSKKIKIEVETRSIADVKEALREGGIDVIMLDNMTLPDMKTCVDLIDGKYKVEASGGITELNLREVASCGVDFISVGALTHSVKSLDLSLKVF